MWSWLKEIFKKKEEIKVEPKKEEVKIEPKKELPIEAAPLPSTNIRIKDDKNDGTPYHPDWRYLWDNCVIDEKAKDKLDKAVAIFVAHRNEYKEVEKITGISEWFVAGLHMRECSFNFKGCLHNGDPWNKVTTHVPKGLGPWKSWIEAAVHALSHDKISADKVNTIEKALEYAFRFNGVGYKTKIGDHGVIEYSPYVCAYTNWHDETSKYKSDGKYDKDAPEAQLGVMAFWKELENRGLINVG